MKKVQSAGGIVFLGNSILMLKKINGDWVLPKGKIKKGEECVHAALREVLEETGVKAMVIESIGETHYKFKNCWSNNDVIDKTVHWYIMEALTSKVVPRRNEGFIEAQFIHVDRVLEFAKYADEREIIKKAIETFMVIM